MSERCKVGVGVMIVEQGRFLVGIRKGSHCAGELSFPGGHIDLEDQSIQSAGIREVYEEVIDPRTGDGLKITINTFYKYQPQVFLRHDIMENGTKAYVTLFLSGNLSYPYSQGIDFDKPMPSREPDKCEEWRWMSFWDLVDHAFQVNCRKMDYYELIGFLDRQLNQNNAWIPLDMIYHHREIIGVDDWL